ncbi:MAG TPA: TetR/AcrR family transcriptional regulator, partial [Solirubrobacteraceae bacterium]|nr:TetR/AcrR family transcriptional regulator [Solirubrobacteraceae bacterium]
MSADKKSLTVSRPGPPAVKPVSPLYKRLPHGPHRLEREEVVRNQRIRIHGAMVEAVAASGYEGTSVKQVIGLAGVSRRSFYEQFANKQECLLATFDLLVGNTVRRAGDAYLASDGPFEERLRAALAEFAAPITHNRKAAGLVIAETPAAGVPGLMRLRHATATCERMLCSSFNGSPDAGPLPVPVVRGIAGGLHGAMWTCLRERRMRSAELTEEMLAWTLRFQTPAAAGMGELIRERAIMSMGGPAPGRGAEGSAASPVADDRRRLMDCSLRLATVEDLRELTAPRIADEANVSIDAFFELFETKEDCFLAALEMLADELLGVTADDGLMSADWPRAVRRAIVALMTRLADRPHYARTIAAEAFAAGPDA